MSSPRSIDHDSITRIFAPPRAVVTATRSSVGIRRASSMIVQWNAPLHTSGSYGERRGGMKTSSVSCVRDAKTEPQSPRPAPAVSSQQKDWSSASQAGTS